MKLKAGEFEVDVWTRGAPIWTHIKFGRWEMPGLDEGALLDLQYVVSRAIREIEMEERRRPK